MSALIKAILLLSSISISTADQLQGSEKRSETVQLHYLMHTSLEVGAFGSTEDAYRVWVTKIIKEIVDQLSKHENYKFNWSEVAYLEMWWQDKEVDVELK